MCTEKWLVRLRAHYADIGRDAAGYAVMAGMKNTDLRWSRDTMISLLWVRRIRTPSISERDIITRFYKWCCELAELRYARPIRKWFELTVDNIGEAHCLVMAKAACRWREFEVLHELFDLGWRPTPETLVPCAPNLRASAVAGGCVHRSKWRHAKTIRAYCCLLTGVGDLKTSSDVVLIAATEDFDGIDKNMD